LKTFKSYFTI